MDQLIVTTLQEGWIYRKHRQHMIFCKARGKGYRVLLCDSYIEKAVGKRFAEGIKACAQRHGGRDGANPLILLRKIA